MINIESKMSGWTITNFETRPIFNSQILSLKDCMKTIKRQETMNFILDTFRFSKGVEEEEGDWFAIVDRDTIMKISIMETNPKEEEQLKEYFGEDWIKYYLRFSH